MIKEYQPFIQHGATGNLLAGTVIGYIPRYPRLGVAGQDDFSNPFSSPLLVRALSINSGAGQAGPFPVEIAVHRRIGGELKWHTDPIDSGQISNQISANLGDLVSTPYRYLWKLWKPYRLKRSETLRVHLGGNVNAASSLTFDTTSLGNFGYTLTGKGAKSGEEYKLGEYRATANNAVFQAKNWYDEDILIKSLSVYCSDNATFPLVKISKDRDAWMRWERPFWLFGEPFGGARMVFDYLPEGCFKLEPGEGLTVRARWQGGATRALLVAMEGYVEVQL